MTEIAEKSRQGATGSEQSTSDQAKEKVQETAQHVQEKAQDLRTQAGGRLRQELDTRSTEAGSQLQSSAEAMRRAGEQLQQEGKEGPARVTTMVADRAERLGNYMTGANVDQIVRDVENFARRQPWLMAIGGAAIGFLGSRFLKASSSSRYAGSNGSSGNGWQDLQPAIPGPSHSNAGLATGTASEPSAPAPAIDRGGAGDAPQQ